jgi:hypothetical protein
MLLVILLIVNLLFGYYMLDNSGRSGIGCGFIVFIPFILGMAITDLIAGLFLQSILRA